MDYSGTGRMIAEARKANELTQKQLAELLHVSDRTISKWERGKGFPDPSLLEPLSDALGIPLSDIVRGERTGVQPEEDFRLREAVRLLRGEVRKKSAALKRLLALVLVVLLIENTVFVLRTGGDGMRRREWVEQFREHYEAECQHYQDREPCRIEWLSGNWRIEVTNAAAIESVLTNLADIELGKEYTNWEPGAVQGFLILTLGDGEMTDSTFVLSFPAFTISSVIGDDPVGRHFYYEATIDGTGAYEKIQDIMQKLVETGGAERRELGEG